VGDVFFLLLREIQGNWWVLWRIRRKRREKKKKKKRKTKKKRKKKENKKEKNKEKTPGGFFENFCTGMCHADFRKLTFSIPTFCSFGNPSLYQFFAKSTQICPNWVLFRVLLPKILPMRPIGRIGLHWKPTHRYTKIAENAPQNGGTYPYTFKIEEPPGHILSSSPSRTVQDTPVKKLTLCGMTYVFWLILFLGNPLFSQILKKCLVSQISQNMIAVLIFYFCALNFIYTGVNFNNPILILLLF